MLYQFTDSNREKFVNIRNKLIDFCESKGYNIGPNSGGGSRGKNLKEAWQYQFVNASGKEVLYYEFDNITGLYNAKVKTNFSDLEEKVIKKIVSTEIEEYQRNSLL